MFQMEFHRPLSKYVNQRIRRIKRMNGMINQANDLMAREDVEMVVIDGDRISIFFKGLEKEGDGPTDYDEYEWDGNPF